MSVQAGNGTTVTRLSGRVKAAERTSLSFEIPGEIRRLNLDVGEHFATGDVLAELDAERYRLVAQPRSSNDYPGILGAWCAPSPRMRTVASGCCW